MTRISWDGTYAFTATDEILVNKWLKVLKTNVTYTEQAHRSRGEPLKQIVFQLIDGATREFKTTNDGEWNGTSDRFKKFSKCTSLGKGSDTSNEIRITNCQRIEDLTTTIQSDDP